MAELEAFRAQAKLEEQNKQVVLDSIAAIDAQDYDRLRELWPENAVFHSLDQPEPAGTEGTIAFIQYYYAAFPDNTHEIHNTIADGDFVATMVTNNATHTGASDFLGFAATGNEINIGGMHLVRVADGKVAEWWSLDDNLSLNTQIGMELKPKE